MMKKAFALFAAFICLVGCLGGCTPKIPENGGDVEPPSRIYNSVIGGEPRTIDSIYSTNITSWDLLRHFMEGLTHVGADGHSIVPGMAASWDVSDDKTTYTFHLRDSLWSDGSQVTAHDFEFAWKTVLAPETGAPYGGNMFIIKNGMAYNAGECSADEVGINAIDEKTLVVETEYYAPYFLTLVSTPLFMPIKQAFYEEMGDEYAMEADTILSNGPWVLTEWAHQEKVVMQKNEGYHSADDIFFETINWPMIEDSTTTYNMFVAGDIDACGIGGIAQIAQATAAGYDVAYTTTGVTGFVEINEAGHPVLANLNFRLALLYGLNRGDFLQSQYGGALTPATGINPPGAMFYETDYLQYAGPFVEDNQIELAQDYLAKALAELGYNDVSQVPRLELIAGTGYETDMAVLQEEWKANLGIEVDVTILPGGARYERRENGDFQLNYMMIGYDYPYPGYMLSLWTKDMIEYEDCWSPKEYNDLYDIACFSMDDQEKLDTMVAMERMLMDSGVCIPYYYSQRSAVQGTDIHGLVRSELANIYLGYAYRK